MTPNKILRVVGIYKKYFEDNKIVEKKLSYNKLFRKKRSALKHCHYMLGEIKNFVEEGRIDKAFRWLGFVQGVLWTTGVYTLDQLKEHNMPSDSD